tara:strand:+ start:474 stop:647 length:174 start_codon:yes stop_codon:yes gene_type:complete
LFNDVDLRFHADDKLITLFLASLQLEAGFNNEYVIVGIVSPSIFFIHNGIVDVTLKD